MKKYLPKFPLTSDESLKPYEVLKIINGIKRESAKITFARFIPIILFALLVVFLAARIGG